MSPTTITTAERIVVEGPFGPSIAIGTGLLLALMFAWILRRESHILGTRNTVLFWVLRTVALAVALWMLIAPSKVLVETSTTRRAIVIASDVSGSMQMVDPAGSSDDWRWVLSRAVDDKFSETREADNAVAAMGIALRQVQIAHEALQKSQQERPIVSAVAAASDAIGQARKHLQTMANVSAETRLSDKCQALVNRLIKLFDGAEFQSFEQLTNAMKKNRTPAQKGWQESFPDLEHRISTIRNTALELARTAVESEEQRRKTGINAQLTSVPPFSRQDNVAKTVMTLQARELSTLREKADIRFASFDHGLYWDSGPQTPSNSQPSAGQADHVSTNLARGTDLCSVFETLQRERNNQPIAAVFLLSDVAHNHPADKNPRDAAAGLADTPVYVVPIGNSQHVRDLRIRSIFAPTVAMRNDDIVIEASIQAFECEGEVCVVQLIQDEKPIDQREILLDSRLANRTVRFEHHVPALGTEHFRVSIVPIEGELTADNNERDFEVNVTRNDIKILLADEYPRWDYRYLTQLLRRDSKIECDELLFHPRTIATGRRETSNSLPLTADEWDQYDVVLLGDLAVDHFPATSQQSLISYLKDRGGTLVLIAGQDSMPHAYADHLLNEILPVGPLEPMTQSKERRYDFRVTAEGHDHQALMIGETEEENRVAWDVVNRYSPLEMVSTWRRPRANARTLISAVSRDSTDLAAEEKNSAFLCWQPVGRGRVVYLSGPESWRLRYLRGDRLHYRFWGQLIRWAIASDLGAGTSHVRVRTEKSRYTPLEAVQITIRLIDGNGAPLVTDGVAARVYCQNDSRTVSLSADPLIPGEYRTEVRSLKPGDYQVEPVGTVIEQLPKEDSQEPVAARFTVQNEASLEMTETRCDRALAQQIAEVTGGQVVPPTAMEEILKLTNLEPIVSQKVLQSPLWVQWKYLWIVFGSLQLEWIIRRRLGLS